MSDSLVLTGVKDVRKHTGTEMLRLNPKGGGDTFSLKRWWVGAGVSTCYEPCTVFSVTTAAGTVKLALATKSEGSRIRIDHDGSFNFSFSGAGQISRACLFTESFEVIESYVFPSISGGKVMTVTPAGAASKPGAGGGGSGTIIGAVSISGKDNADNGESVTYTVLTPDATASSLGYSWSTTGDATITSGQSSASASITFNHSTGSAVVFCQVVSADPNVQDPSQEATPKIITVAPPVAPDTSIGAVTVAGASTANDADELSYTATAGSATATPLAYAWAVTGDATITGGGTTASATIGFELVTGTATVTCSVSSTDAGVTDSPASGNTITVTVS